MGRISHRLIKMDDHTNRRSEETPGNWPAALRIASFWQELEDRVWRAINSSKCEGKPSGER